MLRSILMIKFSRIFSKYSFCSSTQSLNLALAKYYQKNQPLSGFCNQTGSTQYHQRFTNIHEKYWKIPTSLDEKIYLSSLGIGTQNGQPKDEDDLPMFKVLVEAMKNGINMIDTCVLFRYGKSEKVINAALNYLIKEEGFKREEFFVATKCGYIPQDVDSNLDDKEFIKILRQQNYIKDEDIVQDIHCIHPNFINFSIEKSRLALGLNTIDLVYINNLPQSQMPIIGKQKYIQKLKIAIETLEKVRLQKRINYYGMSCFMSFRSPSNEEGIHASLAQCINIAKQIGGKNHGLRFIQTPFNLGMPEIILKWQKDPETNENETLLKIAQKQNININICTPLFQGRLVNVPFQSKKLNHLQTNAAKHLELVRSLKSETLVSTIFSTLNPDHVKENMEICKFPPLTNEEWDEILPINKK